MVKIYGQGSKGSKKLKKGKNPTFYFLSPAS